MAHQHVETNPHFIDPEGPTPEQRHYLPAALLPRRDDQRYLPRPGVMTPQIQGRHPQEHRPHSHLFFPRDRRTKAHTWFAAAFCIIFWLLVIIGGLVVLIVYLVFRPRSPRFDVNSVTLKAAYLDMGYLDLYFENTLIATQNIEPFSAARGQSMFANIHMVTSQVRLSVKDTLLLQRQIENNRVMFTLKGLFRARSNLGGVLKYSYWLHGLCSVMVSSPPTGVLRDKRCRTKH